MAALRDRRHEQVAQALAVMKTPAAASREAGYRDGTSFDANARKRSQRPDIRARVAELQAAQASLVEIDAAWIRHKVARIAGIDFTGSDIKPSEAIAALNLLAKMTKGALVPQTIGLAGEDGEGPVLHEVRWKSEPSKSTTAHGRSSDPSMTDSSASPASSPIDGPERQ